jgi:hypothetical protein
MNSWLLDVTTVGPEYGEPPAGFDGLVPLGTREEARAWLEGESANWLAALRSAAKEGEHARVVEVTGALHWFSDLVVHWDDWVELFELSSGAARALGDRYAEIVHLNYLAWALGACQGRFQDSVDRAMRAARKAFEEALACYAAIGDERAESVRAEIAALDGGSQAERPGARASGPGSEVRQAGTANGGTDTSR